MPFDAGRLARIAWIDPINVPAFLEMKIQTEISLTSRGDPLILCDKIDRAVIENMLHARNTRRIRIINGLKPEMLGKALAGEPVGTVITAETEGNP